ncbi:MAG: polysaccharide pyruvyl transferase family protein [Planctomycetota bacterium]
MAAVGAFTSASIVRAQQQFRPAIVLRSSWQTVNIGDIAHTPGVLCLLEKYIPQAEIRLWPSNVGNGVEPLLRRRFPTVTILKGEQDIQKAFDECDFFLHGSGPFLVAQRDVERWVKATGKPYGVYGITFSDNKYSTRPLPDDAFARTIDVLSGARFVFFRDSPSLALAKEKGCRAPVMEFGPDGAFATDLKDDERAEAFLKENGLEAKKFLCCIPRHRFTPYWTIPERRAPFDPVKNEQNEMHLESDHAPLREAIIEVVRQTEMKVLLCPEDRTQMALGKSILFDRLPEDARSRVVWRPDYWLTGEARSTYLRSAGLFGHEMHSPIMCIGSGIPAIVCRWKEQTSKGWMWKDIGLEEWLFDMDNPRDVPRIVPAVLDLAKDPRRAAEKADRARRFVEKRQEETMAILARELPHAG